MREPRKPRHGPGEEGQLGGEARAVPGEGLRRHIDRHAARHADRLAEISGKALDAIEEAITKFREDLKATRLVRQPDGSITEEPAWYMTPKDLAILIDRFQVLFE